MKTSPLEDLAFMLGLGGLIGGPLTTTMPIFGFAHSAGLLKRYILHPFELHGWLFQPQKKVGNHQLDQLQCSKKIRPPGPCSGPRVSFPRARVTGSKPSRPGRARRAPRALRRFCGGAEITEFAVMVAMGPEKMKDAGFRVVSHGFPCHSKTFDP